MAYHSTIPQMLLLVGLLLLDPAAAFQAPMLKSASRVTSSRNIVSEQSPWVTRPNVSPFQVTKSTTTQLSMYNLPPSGGSGGGGGKNDSVITQVLQGALVIGGIILFFASPLGAIFFAITNSLFLLALITPVILTIAFQIWQSLNTIEGPCPNCGAPQQRVFKDPNQPGICFNCGSIIQASQDLKSIELLTPVTGRRAGDFIDMDQLVNPASATGSSIFDIFGNVPFSDAQQQPTVDEVKAKEAKFKRERTVIDVEVQE